MRCLLSVGLPVGALVLAVIVLVVAIGPAAGQARSVGVVPAPAPERRVALVIGNDAYQQVERLERAASDARAVGAELGRLGFEVLSHANLDRRGMNQALRSFVDQVGGGGVGVLFFAGHGVQVGGVNYLLPVDIQATRSDDLADEALDLGIVMERLAIARAKFVLLIIDACRDNPFPKVAGRGVGASRGLTIPSAPDGLMVVYSAGINERALDKLSASDTDANGLFTREFLKQLRVPGVRVDEMVRRVRGAVREQALKVRHVQNPAIYDQSSGDFFFSLLAPEASTAGRAPGVDQMTIELAFWDSIRSSSDPEDFRAYLSQFPSGRFAALARNRLAAMGSSSAPPPRSTPPPRAPEPTQVAVVPPPPASAPPRPAVTRPSIGTAAPGVTFRDCDACPEMVVVAAGHFVMGSPDAEQGRDSNEGPPRRVAIGRPFAAGKYEVTFDEWDACAREGGCAHKPDDRGWGRGRRPVINVSWEDAKRYVQWLSRKTGKTYRLLTEAEWEYVARAGTTAPFSSGAAITAALARSQTATVGSFSANAFGLHDVHGNVWEWVEDCYNSAFIGAPGDGAAWTAGGCRSRVLRGGSWANVSWHARSAVRNANTPSYRSDSYGLRVATTD